MTRNQRAGLTLAQIFILIVVLVPLAVTTSAPWWMLVCLGVALNYATLAAAKHTFK